MLLRLLKSWWTWMVVVVLVILWYFTPYYRGILMAHIDHGCGHYQLKVYGCGLRSEEQQERYSKYVQLLKDRYGVEFRYVAECVVSDELTQYADGYNSVSNRLLFDKYGRDIFKECSDLAKQE